jgi:hypothetical protein
MESLRVACQLYVWHIKLNECAVINTLPLNEYSTKWNKNVDRLCNIANVPLKKPSDFQKTKDEDGNDVDPSEEIPLEEPPLEEPPLEESPSDLPPSDLPPSDLPPSDLPPSDLPPSDLPPSDLPPSDLPPSESPTSASPPSVTPSSNSDDLPKYDIPESTDQEKTTKNINENFTESIIEQFNYADYKYIIGTFIFILFLVIIYIRYKN